MKQVNADRRAIVVASHWLARAFKDNWRVKVISLILAIGFVAFHRGQRDDRLRTVSVGLVWHTPPEHENRELMTRMPSEVHVTLRGPRKTLEDLLETGVPPITLDLRSGSQQRVNFDPEMFSFPPELEVKIIDPSGIDFKWEDVVERSIPIQSSFTGVVAQGFETGSVGVEPTLIVVRGPRSVVEAMQSARLAPFDVTGLSGGNYARQIALDPPPSRVGYLGALNATVSVEIRRREIPLKFAERKVEIVGPPQATAKPRVVDVTITGPPEVINALRAEQMVPRVDFAVAGINVGEQPHGAAALPVTVDVANAKVEVQPPTVLVRW